LVLNAKRGLRDALSKNTSTFHRIGDAYGLVEWYPKPPRPERPAKKVRSSNKKAKRTKVAQEPNAAAADNVVDLKSEAEKAA
jgi:hypothetical protein